MTLADDVQSKVVKVVANAKVGVEESDEDVSKDRTAWQQKFQCGNKLDVELPDVRLNS